MTTTAALIAKRNSGLAAWNFTAEEKAELTGMYGNQYGTRYNFKDGSVGWVDKGCAKFCVLIGAAK